MRSMFPRSPDRLGPTQRDVFEAISEADEPLTRSEIVDRCGLDRFAVCGALGRLQRKEMLETEEIDPRGWLQYRVAEEVVADVE